MITVVASLFDPNEKSFSFSRCYSEEWVEKLYRGFARNLTRPFRFVCFTERERTFAHAEIEQERFAAAVPTYTDGYDLYRLPGPLIVLGLDTIITGNIDHLADYCMTADKVALPRAVYRKGVCNGVALTPADHAAIYRDWRGENDMDWLEAQPHVVIDDLWPGHVVSYKGRVKHRGLGDARIVFFHGKEKPHELNEPWIAEHWR